MECSRFVIWKGVTLDECSPEDRNYLRELLKSLGLETLQDLNGIDPLEITEFADRFGQVLSTLDLGRLVHVFWPGAVSQRSPSRNLLLLSQNVDTLELSARSAHCLQDVGITTIRELTQWSAGKLLTIKNMGLKSAGEIKAKLEELLLQDSDESQLQLLGRPETFCLSALLTFEQCSIDEDIGQTLMEAGVSRVDDLVTRGRESLRYWAGLSDADLGALERQLGLVDLHLESLLPLWVRTHYLELTDAFKEDLEELLSRDTVINSAALPPLTNPPTPTCLEEELDTFFAANVNDRKKEIVRLLIWGGTVELEQRWNKPDTSLNSPESGFDRFLSNLSGM